LDVVTRRFLAVVSFFEETRRRCWLRIVKKWNGERGDEIRIRHDSQVESLPTFLKLLAPYCLVG